MQNQITLGVSNLLAELAKERTREKKTIPLPWPMLDSAIGGGLRRGKVTCVAGHPGGGKSYLGLAFCFNASVQGFRWIYLPLEDSQLEATRRMAAIVSEDWAMIDQDDINAERREATVKANMTALAELSVSIRENPRRPIIDQETRKLTVPKLPYHSVCSWIGDQKGTVDLIVIDPVSQIDFRLGSEKEWDGQDTFVRQVCALAEDTGIHIVLVAHVKKRTSMEKAKGSLSMDDICGSSAFSKFVQNVILLERHDPRESEVRDDVGEERCDWHKWTLHLDKSRDGKGAGYRFAMDLSHSPLFRCSGTIIPQSKTPWKGK
jgi:KaiC/GvpD/RAD55 family RecA-like ATPase